MEEALMKDIKNLLIEMAQGLVSEKDSVSVKVDEVNEEKVIVFHLDVSDADKGRVIGKQGRIARAIRTIMRAAANRMGYKVIVDIV